MNIAELSIKRPIFIGCLVLLMVITGIIGLRRLNVELFPPVDYPVVTVTTFYSGATPEEVEKLITKPLEEQVNVISGLKKLTSYNMDGVSIVVAEFSLETEVRYAEEKMREKVALARPNLPTDLDEEPIVRQYDFFTNVPVVTFALTADLSPEDLYDLAHEKIKPTLESQEGIGEVRIIGGTRREVQVELDIKKLNTYEISAIEIANQIKSAGANIPVGDYDSGKTSTMYRTIGEFRTIEQIQKTVVGFGGEVSSAVTLDKLGVVRDGAADPKTISSIYYPVEDKKSSGEQKNGFFSGKNHTKVTRLNRPCILLDIYKQSGSNTVAVVDRVNKKMQEVNRIIKGAKGNPRMVYVYDSAQDIKSNIEDVNVTMIIGIILTFFVVYIFLGNIRSTIITGLAIPNSLLGAFVLMYAMGFSINMMTLMALSLTVGLLVDDAIVVRENIFRKIESGMPARKAAIAGTTEVMLAVIATTITILAVFLPIGFLQGIVGRFFRQFGLTVVFAMAISLFDALAVAPLLSAYYAGKGERAKNIIVRNFERFQGMLERLYSKTISFSLARPLIVMIIATAVMIGSMASFMFVKKTFFSEAGEYQYLINLEMQPEINLKSTYDLAEEISAKIQKIPEVDYISVQAGNEEGEKNVASIGVFFLKKNDSKKTNIELKENLRTILTDYKQVKSSVDYFSRVGGGSDKPFILQLKGENLDELLAYSGKLMERLEKIPDLVEVASSHTKGKPEYRVVLNEQKMQMLGVTHKIAGLELRYHVDGDIVGKLRDKGLEYDIRMRLKPEQRNLREYYNITRVPNVHMKLISLSAISNGEEGTAPAKILRQNRTRIVQITANLTLEGAVGSAIESTKNIFKNELPLPEGITYGFEGDADIFQDTVNNMLLAFFLSIIFIYLALASLYESFITPFTIFLALPPALSGAFLALFITGKQLDLMGMIGLIMLLGLVTKNSILLVDFAVERVKAGMSRKEAIAEAGRLRLRPVLMTTFATLAGTLPIALGVGEASKYRASMGTALMGGIIVSTFITLVVVPAMFEYIDIFREFIETKLGGDNKGKIKKKAGV